MRILVVSALACFPFLGSAMAQTQFSNPAFGNSVSVELGGPPLGSSTPSIGPYLPPGHVVLPESPGKIHAGDPPPGQWSKPGFVSGTSRKP
jgi:hypothetical protein